MGKVELKIGDELYITRHRDVGSIVTIDRESKTMFMASWIRIHKESGLIVGTRTFARLATDKNRHDVDRAELISKMRDVRFSLLTKDALEQIAEIVYDKKNHFEG